MTINPTTIAAWAFFILGTCHVLYGFVKYKAPLLEAIGDGFVDQFKHTELRRAAFWFVIFGPMLMFAGHAAIHAARVGDLQLLKLIGGYGFAIAVVGVLAFPKSPFWAALFITPWLLAAGFGWIAI